MLKDSHKVNSQQNRIILFHGPLFHSILWKNDNIMQSTILPSMYSNKITITWLGQISRQFKTRNGRCKFSVNLLGAYIHAYISVQVMCGQWDLIKILSIRCQEKSADFMCSLVWLENSMGLALAFKVCFIGNIC